MPSTSFQDRVRLEREELADKIVKLKAFFPTEKYVQLPLDEQLRLNLQADIMDQYYNILTERIINFKD